MDNPEELIEYHTMGYPDGLIAEKLGVSRETVRRWRGRLGLAPNRKRGERGPTVLSGQAYYNTCSRLMKYTGRYINQAAQEGLEQGEIDPETCFLSGIMQPAPVRHPQPVLAPQNPLPVTDAQAERIVSQESQQAMAGLAGVPGPAILELARIYKTASEATIKELSRRAVRESGLVGILATNGDVRDNGTVPVHRWQKTWQETSENLQEWMREKS